MFLKNERQTRIEFAEGISPSSKFSGKGGDSGKTLTIALSLALLLATSAQAQYVPDGMGANSSPTDPDMEDLWHDHEPTKNNKVKLKQKNKSAGNNENKNGVKPEKSSPSASSADSVPESEKSTSTSTSKAPESTTADPASILGGDEANNKPEVNKSNSDSEDRLKSAAAPITARPGSLGSLAGFVSGDLIKTSTWPGFGPFKNKGEGENEFADDRENKLKLHAEGDDISAVELLLKEKPATKQGFLNLQMILDFTMEAVGMRPARISELNTFVEKNKERVTRGDIPVITTCGDYSIALVPTPQKDAIVIQLTPKDSSVKHSALLPSASEEKQEESLNTEPAQIATAVKTETKINKPLNKKNKAPVKAPAKPNSSSTTNATPTTPSTINNSNSGEQGTQNNTARVEGDSLKKELGDVIRTWQSIKKTAVKERQIEQLGKILSGAALSRQTKSIKWLADNKQYYDLTPEGVIVDKYSAISQMPLRYSVYAKVKERSKLMPEAGGKPIDEQETTYDVNYTLERVNDHWTISDSLIVKKNGDRSGQKTR